MRQVDLMGSSTLCWKKPQWSDVATGWPSHGWVLLWTALLLLAVSGRLHAAEAAAPPSWPITLHHGTDGVLLSARVPLTLTPALEEALHKGIPLHFVWESTVLRRRWYWSDKTVWRAARTVRLAYQPLIRRWRVSVVDGLPNSTNTSALHQNFDTLNEAWPSVSRVSGWKIADPTRLSPDEDYRVQLGFRLDVTALPGPLQMGMLSTQERGLSTEQTLLLPPLGGVSEMGQPVRDATVQTLRPDTAP